MPRIERAGPASAQLELFEQPPDLAELDRRARVSALDISRSLLLQAPAGSGKTTVLTARFLCALAAVDQPEEILAITFTRKAAAEMRHRILAALRQSARSPGIDPALIDAVRRRDRERGWQLLDSPARLRVETIDALNSRLAHALPVAARAAPGLTIAPAPGSLYRRAARQALEAAWSDAGGRDAVERLFWRLDNDWQRTQRLLAEMLAHRSHWLPRVLDASDGGLARRVADSLRSLLPVELAALRAHLPAALLEEGEALLRQTRPAAEGTPARVGLLGTAPSDLPHWRALAELALTDNGWRRQFTIKQGFARGDVALKQRAQDWIESLEREPHAMQWLRNAQGLPDAQLPAEDELALEALGQLLVRAATHLQLVFAESGKVDYAYVAGAARQSLTEGGEPTDLALRTGAALRHVLVDEFQDTSYEQFQLLERLTAGWERGDGRTLFLVGDPMQSIYQFREAEVGLFLRARERGVGALPVTPLQLRRNFRTRAPLLEWINLHFAALFPLQDDARLAAIRYLRSVPAAAGAVDESAVQLHRFAPGDREGEARRVLQIVQQARAARADATIAVLVASREHAGSIVRTLRTAGIALRGVDLEPLGEQPVVRDLAALTRALLHGADRTAWLALLRAPWSALSLEELEPLFAAPVIDVFAAVSEGVRTGAPPAAPLARLVQALSPALSGAERSLPLWQRVEGCWLRLGGPGIYAQPAERLQARRYLEALASCEEPEELVGDGIARLTGELYSAEPAQPGAVEIMTMHAAKGLEWDVVILPGLGRSTARDADPLLHWIELPRTDGGDSELLLAPIRASEHEPRGSLAAYIKSVRRERARIERVRLAYVAATRARHSLHLLGSLASVEGESPRAAAGSLLRLLWPAIGEPFAATPLESPDASVKVEQAQGAGVVSQQASVPGTHEGSGATLWRVPAHWRLPPAPEPLRVSRLTLGAELPAAMQPEYSWVGGTARAIGTIVHAELHRLALTTPLPSAPAAARGAEGYADWLAELGVPPEERPAASARVTLALQRTLADPQGRWLLGQQHREAHSEWRLSGLYDGRVINAVVDRMLVDAQGERWIVDFKTSHHEGGAVETFLDNEVERYRAQMLRYATLVRALGPEPVRLALYFPLMGVLRAL
jgi:ATP-dependent exoDNAse (exonuclease V) beta subunit